MKRLDKNNRNRLLLIAVALGFAIVACIFLYRADLAEYEGSLEENLSYELPEGYEPVTKAVENDPNGKEFIRVTDTTRERILIYYYGLDEGAYFEWDDPVKLDDSTEYSLSASDWDHDEYNELTCEIRHGKEAYDVKYRCQETDKEDYYSSCSDAQKEDLLAFVKTFSFHRPDNESVGNVFKRLYLNYGIAGLVILVLGVLVFIGIPIGAAIGGLFGSKEQPKDDGPVIRSSDLHESMNRERESRGESSLPTINTVQGTSTNNLARRDHSWSSVPDFFIKLFRRK